MKKVRRAGCVLFAVSCVVFIAYLLVQWFTADRIAPEIYLKEDAVTVSVNTDDAGLLKGVRAKDNKDGDITDTVRIASKSHFIEKGKRVITYVVFDKANHAASAEQTVTYRDYVPPRIYLSEPLRYTVNEVRNGNILKNMTAEDCLLGDLSGQISVSLEDAWYSEEPGEYALTVQVGNDAGDVCSIPMSITIKDSNSLVESKKYYPILSEYIVYTSAGQPLELEKYLTGLMKGNTKYYFEDAELGVTPERVVISADIDYDTAGVYEVEYNFTSSEGISAVTKLYVVVEE